MNQNSPPAHPATTPDAPLLCAANTNTGKLAGAIANALRTYGHAALRVVGASAINQAIKASAKANFFLSQDGQGLVMWPEFVEVTLYGEARTAILFHYRITEGVQHEA